MPPKQLQMGRQAPPCIVAYHVRVNGPLGCKSWCLRESKQSSRSSLWLVQGKIVFCAPTKPLLNQQVTACYEKMSISKVRARWSWTFTLIVNVEEA